MLSEHVLQEFLGTNGYTHALFELIILLLFFAFFSGLPYSTR